MQNVNRSYSKMVGRAAHIFDDTSRYQPLMIVYDLALVGEVLALLDAKEDLMMGYNDRDLD